MSTNEERFQQFQAAENHTAIVDGDCCYIIDMKWFNLFQDYSKNSIIPSNIDNSEIFDPSAEMHISHSFIPSRLKIVTKNGWNVLMQWYQCDKIIVSYYATDLNDSIIKPILRYVTVQANYQSQHQQITFHEYADVDNIHKDLRALFHVHNNIATDLYLYQKEKNKKIELQQNMIQNVTREDQLFLETSLTKRNFNIYHYNDYIGLENTGNTCFLNSVLQVLFHTKFLIQFFSDQFWRQQINYSNKLGSEGQIATILSEFFQTHFIENRSSYFDPSQLKTYIASRFNKFKGTTQEDAHEFLLFLLDMLHEDLNRCKVKGTSENLYGDDKNDAFIAKKTIENIKKRNDSIVYDNFSGILKNKCLCPECFNISVIFDHFITLSVPIKDPVKEFEINCIYIPYDFLEERVSITLTLQKQTNITYKSISKQVSEILGKEVSVAYARKNKTSEYYEWGIIDSSSETAITYLFEIPDLDALTENFRILKNNTYYRKTSIDTNLNQKDDLKELKQKLHYYVPCNIKGRIKPKNSQFCTYKDLTGPFLIEVSDLKKNISQNCSHRIKYLWETDKELLLDKKYALTPEKEEIKKCIRLTHDDFDGKPIRITINGAGNLLEDDMHSFLVKNSLSIEINKDYTMDENFSYEILLLHYKFSANNSNNLFSNMKKKPEKPFFLSDSLSLFFQNEELDENNEWYCPHCSKFVRPTKKTDIWTCPEFLVLHLKRFITESSSSRKNDQLVRYPSEINLKNYIVGPLVDGDARYRLYAVIQHHGTINSGHYTAICKSPNTNSNTWYSYNDSNVSMISESSVLSLQNAYLLFYERY